MTYAAWSVVFGEQPSAAKWNILGTNDSSFNDSTGINLQYNNLSGFSNPYQFSAYRNAAINTGSNAFAKIIFDTELYDTNNNFATGTYTIPVSGFYHFEWGGQVTSTGASQAIITSLYKNGTEIRRGSRVISSATSQVMGGSGGGDLQVTAGDTMEVWGYGTVTLAFELTGASADPYFMGRLISRT